MICQEQCRRSKTSANGERWTNPRALFLHLKFTHWTTCAQRSVLRSLEALTY